MKLIKSILLTFIIVAAATTLAFSQKSETTETTASTEQVENTKTLALKVKGVGCATDLKMITDNVEKLEGVTSCKVEKMGATTSLKVKMNPALVTEKQIQAAIETTGTCEDPNARQFKVKS